MLPKKCMHCERRFTKAEHLKRHQRSHTGERPYKCIQCSKRFSRSDVLGRHLKNHTQQNNAAAAEEAEEVLSPVENGQRDRRNSSNAGFVQNSMTIDQNSEIIEPRSEDLSVPPHVNISSFQEPTLRYNDTSPLQPSPSGLDHLATISAQQRQNHGSIDATMTGVPSSIGLSPMNNVDDWNHLDLSVRDPQPPNGVGNENVFLPNDTTFNNLNSFTSNSAYLQMNGVPDFGQPNGLQNGHMMPSIAELTQDSVAMPDVFQSWFEQYDREIHAHGGMFGVTTPFNTGRGLNGLYHQAESRREFRAPSTTSSNDNIPNARFAKVQQCWPARPSSAVRLMPTLWRDVISKAEQNLVSETNSPHEVNHTQQYGSRWGLDDECRDRLLKVFGGGVYTPGRYMYPKAFENAVTTESPAAAAADNSFHSPESDVMERFQSANFPPAEILDIGLDLYFRQFHPLMPFIHSPTFCPKTARPSMVFVMCLIGLTILNTKGATTFVQRAFPALYEKLSAELILHASGNCAPLEIMITFANAMLMTNLAEITGVEDNQEKAHMLYVNAVAIAQRHGIFTANEGQPLDKSMFEDIADLDQRWKAWSRVESAKRLIMSLAMTDAWFSGSLHVSPLLRTDAIQVLLPCDGALFSAKTATKWAQLVAKGNPVIMPALVLAPKPVSLPKLSGTVDVYGMQGLLSIIRLRISEAYHRLISGPDRRTVEQAFVPWRLHVGDHRAESIRKQVIEVGESYEDMLRDMNPNCIVLWHNMVIMLTADPRIFELAAGRAGVDPARQALEDISIWSQTPSARRAVIHAAQTFKVMSNRRASDGAMFHSAAGLFASALVLGLWVFMVPSVENGNETETDDTEPFELLDDIDWKAVGNAGLVDPEDEDTQLQADRDDPAVQFIRKGGRICFSGTLHQPGYQPAKRLLLDYARLLEDIGKWKVGKFSRVLRIMSDALVDVEGQEADL